MIFDLVIFVEFSSFNQRSILLLILQNSVIISSFAEENRSTNDDILGLRGLSVSTLSNLLNTLAHFKWFVKVWIRKQNFSRN